MEHVSLLQVALLLMAAAVAAPLARWLKVGTVLGYLAAGVALGPFGIGQAFSVYQAKEILHIAEFGVVLLLFLIGLELRPTRLWSMRASIFGLGTAQVSVTAALLAGAGLIAGASGLLAVFLGLALALSSTAFALQVLEEKKELTSRHGRLAFSILLFQDLAAIPLIAIVPLFAVTSAVGGGMSFNGLLLALATIAAVIVVGYAVLDRALSLVARTGVQEAMTAAALLTVVGTALVMQQAGLSASLGAFLAGALLSESSYRHQLEADLKPFEGLLLGLFFTTIGMSLKLEIIAAEPAMVVGLTLGLLAIKTVVLFGLGIWQGLETRAARRLALVLSQGGEFAFVLLTQGVMADVLDEPTADLMTVVVTLSMAATPLLLLADDFLAPARATPREPDPLPDRTGHVIIAGFGRFGQIVARILRAKRIPFTALDLDAEQIDFVKQFGAEAFFGDASRLDILEAAQAGKASALVLAIDDVEASVRTAEIVRTAFPDLPIYARARNRNHVHRLMDHGVQVIRRETFLSALDLTRELLRGLGHSQRDVRFAVETFVAHDERRLIRDYQDHADLKKLQERARTDAETLADLFADDERQAAGAGLPKVPADSR
ncbi:MAG: cation:proton antiporter [Hyphomicrobiaceae bacterium]|nr:cation:proton antiporter [Hyphomicrobiaceae bacterium]